MGRCLSGLGVRLAPVPAAAETDQLGEQCEQQAASEREAREHGERECSRGEP